MNEAKHTPGPWHLEEMGYNSSSYYIRGSSESGDRLTIGKGAVAHIPRSTVNPMEANARLIAAAPENLQSNYELAMIVRELCAAYGHPLPEAAIARSDAAIAKATGGADSADGEQKGQQ